MRHLFQIVGNFLTFHYKMQDHFITCVYISQGSVSTPLRCDGTFTRSLQSPRVKKF